MANVVMNYFKTESAKGNVNLESAGALKVALIGNIFGVSASDVLDNLDYWYQISAAWEVSGTEYSATGQTLANTAVIEDDTLNRGYLSASNMTWNNATITSYGAAIYRESDSLLVALIDFGSAKTSTAGDFTIQWNASGVIYLT